MNASLEAATLVPEDISKLVAQGALLPPSRREFAKSLHDQFMRHWASCRLSSGLG